MERNDENSESLNSIESLFSGRFNKRNITKIIFIALVAISMSLYHLYTAGFGTLEAWQQRSITLCFILILIPLVYPTKTKSKHFNIAFDALFFMLAILSIVYTLTVYPDTLFRETSPNQNDLIYGSIMIILILEGTRRTVGYFLTAIILISVLYSFLGNYFPGM